MTYTQITTDWNADPNDPQVQLSVGSLSVSLEFSLNNLQFDNFKIGDKAKLTFLNCHKFSFNNMNDEGYYMGQYRYKYNELPWGEFYKLETNWKTDFPRRHTVLNEDINIDKLHHYIFFFKDNTFECVAEKYELSFKLADETRTNWYN